MCKACENDWRYARPSGGSFADMRRACSEAKRKGLPTWLAPAKRPAFASLPGGTAPTWYDDGPESRAGRILTAGEIKYGTRPNGTPTSERLYEIPRGRWWETKCVVGLSDAGRKAELARQAKRLAGHPEDN